MHGRAVARCSRSTCANSACQDVSSPGYSQIVVSGGPICGQHPVEGQPLDAVAAAEAVDLQLAVAAEDLEREQVLPLGAARVQPGDLSRRPSAAARSRCPRPPSPRSSARRVPRRRAKSPANQRARSIRWTPWSSISPPPAMRRVAAPLALHPRAGRRGRSAPRMNISGPHAPLVPDLARLHERRVEAVVEAHLDDHAARVRAASTTGRARRASRRRLLDEHVLAALDGRASVSGASASLVVATTTSVDVVAIAMTAWASAPRRSPGCCAARRSARALRRVSATATSRCGAGRARRARFCPISPQPTMPTFTRSRPSCLPRSSGTMRRSV